MSDTEQSTNTEKTLVFNSGKEVIEYVDRRLQEDRLAHIEIKSFENRGVFDTWMKKTKLWYDPNTCGCKKKGLSESSVTAEYVGLGNMNQDEKNKAYRIIGSQAELRHEGNLIVILP